MRGYCKTSSEGRGERDGFGAVVAVMISCLGTFAVSCSALMASMAYSDSVDRLGWRIQAGLNADSCAASAQLILADDPFAIGHTIDLPEFGCELELGISPGGHIHVIADTVFNGVKGRSESDI